MNVLLSTAPTTAPSIPGMPSLSTIPGIPSPQGFPSPQGISSPSVTYSGSGSVGLGPFVGVLFDVLAIAVVLAVVGIFVIVVVANRADPDPRGHRPQSVYYFAVSFVTILTSVTASTVIVVAVTLLIGSHSSPIADSIARAVVLGGLIALVSVTLLITHLRQGLALARDGADAPSPSRRVGQSYVSAVSFVMVIALLVATVSSAYLVFALAGPGVFGDFGGRSHQLRDLIDLVYVGGVAVVVLRTHRNLVSPGLHLFGGTGAADGPRPPMAGDTPVPSLS